MPFFPLSSRSTLFSIPLKVVSKIRFSRSTTGLRPQHLAGIELLRDLCDGKLLGGYVGSSEIEFKPGDLRHGDFTVDTKTAGSIVLLIQACFPCFLFSHSDSTAILIGGTNATGAPQIDYLTNVFKPMFERNFGVEFVMNILKRGFYPRGGGKVELKVKSLGKSQSLPPVIILERGDITSINGKIVVSEQISDNLSQKILSSAKKEFRSAKFFDIPIEIEIEK
ncbi:hypothetical protein HK096_006136, partial [Nowakowskiella sp. JEL0078]